MTTVYLRLPPGARVLHLPASWDAFAFAGRTYRIVTQRGIRLAKRQPSRARRTEAAPLCNPGPRA